MKKIVGFLFLFFFCFALFGLPFSFISFCGIFLSSVLIYFLISKYFPAESESYLNLKTFPYFFWLCLEIAKSSFFVARAAWARKIKLKPSFAEIPLKNTKSELSKVLYANSVTLTPGTIALDIKKNTISVHALDESLIEDLRKGDMENRIQKIISTEPGKKRLD